VGHGQPGVFVIKGIKKGWLHEVENRITWIKEKCAGMTKEKQIKTGFLLVRLRESSLSWDNGKNSRGIEPVYCTEEKAVAMVN